MIDVTKLKEQIKTTDRAVSPVIGVILMVAITVILAAVIGTFVLDLGQSVGQTGPTASLSVSDADANFDQSNSGTVQDMFVVEHQGGDDLELADMRITIRNVSSNQILLSWTGSGGVGSSSAGSASDWQIDFNGNDVTSSASSTMGSGDVIVIQVDPTSTVKSEGLQDDSDFKILITDQDTDNTVAQATLKLK